MKSCSSCGGPLDETDVTLAMIGACSESCLVWGDPNREADACDCDPSRLYHCPQHDSESDS